MNISALRGEKKDYDVPTRRVFFADTKKLLIKYSWYSSRQFHLYWIYDSRAFSFANFTAGISISSSYLYELEQRKYKAGVNAHSLLNAQTALELISEKSHPEMLPENSYKNVRLRERHDLLNSLIDYLRVHYSHSSHSYSVRYND